MILTPLELPDLVDWSDPLSDDPLNRGLVGWWLAVPNAMGWGSNTVRGLTGQNHGTLTGGVQWSGASDRPGGFGSFGFSGTAKIETASVAGITTNQISASCWIKPNALSRGDLVTKWQNGGNPGDQFNLLYGVTSGKPALYVSAGGGAIGGEVGSRTMSAGRWHHVCGTFDGATVSIYLDGTLEASGSHSLSLSTGGTPPYRLGNNGVNDGQFNGSIDAVRIYNRALSSPEVAALYEAEKRYHDGLLNRYDMMAAVGGGVTSAWRYYQQFAGRAG